MEMEKKTQNQDLDKDALKQYRKDFGIEYVDELVQFQLCHHCN